MQQEYNDKKDQDRKDPSAGKILPQRHDEDFNTDSDRPLSNVGPGYDDTGLGNDARSSLNEKPGDPNHSKQKKKNQKNKKG